MNVLTVTMNPVLDKSTRANIVVPEKKTRCQSPFYAPGGGGINVSRAIKKLGGKSTAFFVAGGENGEKIQELLKEEDVDYKMIDSGRNSRENVMVKDSKTGNLYRFVMPGNELKEEVWKKAFDAICNFSPKPDYLIASGSLPPGVPDDFYARIAKHARENDIRMILDTSGPPLKMALKNKLFLIKPNLREIREILNKESIDGIDLENSVTEILEKEYCSVLIVSLGAKGALFASSDNDVEYIVPPVMPVKSAVGAGDSMIAGMMMGCINGLWPEQAIRYGVAAGTAATMTPGTELCRKEDTEKIYNWLITNNGKN